MILPIHLLHSGDESLFGEEYVLLSKLGRHGFPIASGVIVASPQREVKQFLAERNIKSLADFEVNKNALYQQLQRSKPSLHMMNQAEHAYAERVWPELIARWLGQLHSHFLRFGEFSPKHFRLSSQPILFVSSPPASGVVRWNHLHNRPEVKLLTGELDLEGQLQVEQLVEKAYKKVGVHYDYSFIVDEGIKFTRLSQANHELPRFNSVAEIKQDLPKNKLKRGMKLYSQYSGNFVLDQTADGYFLKSEDFHSHDEKLNVLVETMLAKSPTPILYQVSNRFIKSDAAVLHYCRNQKKLENVQVVFDADVTLDNLLEVKRELASLGVARKGKLQFLVSIGIPAAVLRLEAILEAGFDGVIFDLDSLAAALHGRDPFENFSQHEAKTLLAFLEPVVKKLPKQKINTIFSQSSGISEEILESAIKWGVSGLIVNTETDKADELIAYQEYAVRFAL